MDWVIDASGQRCFIGRSRRTVNTAADLKATASYGYFENASGLPEPLGRHVQHVVSIDNGWIWFIPTSPTLTSIGLVTQQTKTPKENEFESIVRAALSPIDLGDWITRHGSRLHHVRDWSYVNQRPMGTNWVTCGDAFAFVDPILSGGVDFGIRSGLSAAVAIARAQSGDEEALEAYVKQHTQEIQSYLRMARYWYGNNRSVDGFFWEARDSIPAGYASTPLRAFVYLTSGQYAADQHFKVFSDAQEKRIFEALGVSSQRLRTALKSTRDR